MVSSIVVFTAEEMFVCKENELHFYPTWNSSVETQDVYCSLLDIEFQLQF